MAPPKKKMTKERKQELKDKRKAINRAYYLKNRDRLLRGAKVTVQCDCGCSVVKGYLQGHLLSEKHKVLLKLRQDVNNILSRLDQDNTPVVDTDVVV